MFLEEAIVDYNCERTPVVCKYDTYGRNDYLWLSSYGNIQRVACVTPECGM